MPSSWSFSIASSTRSSTTRLCEKTRHLSPALAASRSILIRNSTFPDWRRSAFSISSAMSSHQSPVSSSTLGSSSMAFFFFAFLSLSLAFLFLSAAVSSLSLAVVSSASDDDAMKSSIESYVSCLLMLKTIGCVQIFENVWYDWNSCAPSFCPVFWFTLAACIVPPADPDSTVRFLLRYALYSFACSPVILMAMMNSCFEGRNDCSTL
mmetsp:Transcript_33819/g.79866  ORF Transcript_33819/g.79866 Transcript_33819/m.79866 type:complete len:208 (+) Transcript_33819:469-1092(+)